MALSKMLDPLALWRESINRLEGGINKLATNQMESEQFAQALAQFSKVRLGMHHVSNKALAMIYAGLDVPSRSEVAALADTLQRIESKLDLLLPAQPSRVPNPPRTRRAPHTPDTAKSPSTRSAPPAPKPAARRARVAKGKA